MGTSPSVCLSVMYLTMFCLFKQYYFFFFCSHVANSLPESLINRPFTLQLFLYLKTSHFLLRCILNNRLLTACLRCMNYKVNSCQESQHHELHVNMRRRFKMSPFRIIYSFAAILQTCIQMRTDCISSVSGIFGPNVMASVCDNLGKTRIS